MGDEPTKAEGHRARSGPPALAEAKRSCPPSALLTTGSGSASSGIGLDVFMQRLSVCLPVCLPAFLLLFPKNHKSHIPKSLSELSDFFAISFPHSEKWGLSLPEG